jgi:hypothetical protein
MYVTDPIAVGNTAKVYLFENKIVKVFNEHLPDGQANYEANKQTFAHSNGLPVPEMICVKK